MWLKQRKKSRFLDFKNRKKTFSRTMVDSSYFYLIRPPQTRIGSAAPTFSFFPSSLFWFRVSSPSLPSSPFISTAGAWVHSELRQRGLWCSTCRCWNRCAQTKQLYAILKCVFSIFRRYFLRPFLNIRVRKINHPRNKRRFISYLFTYLLFINGIKMVHT